MPESIRVWDQQPQESDKSYLAFTCYLHKGPAERSIKAVSDEMHVSMSQLEQWSHNNGWTVRKNAYDRAQDRARRQVRRAKLLAMSESHGKMGQELVEIGISALRDLHPSSLEPKDLIALVKLGLDVEQRSHSYTTEDLQMVANVAADAAKAFNIKLPEADAAPVAFDDIL